MTLKLIRCDKCNWFLDSCSVNNGGCDANAVCSYDSSCNAMKCTCKTGYTNAGSGSNVVCKGDNFIKDFLK